MEVKKPETESILDFYNARYALHGRHAKALDMSPESQRLRFQVLAKVGNLRNASLLDVGCGFGDYLDFLKQERIPVQYTGLDINASFVSEASHRHPEAEFILADIEDFPPGRRFDYVTVSGSFNVRFREDQEEWVLGVIRSLFERADKALAINLISTYVDKGYERDDICYFSPEKIFALGRSLTPWVVLRHDYLPHDFTLFLYRGKHEDAR